jgi:hypothetical protein
VEIDGPPFTRISVHIRIGGMNLDTTIAGLTVVEAGEVVVEDQSLATEKETEHICADVLKVSR